MPCTAAVCGISGVCGNQVTRRQSDERGLCVCRAPDPMRISLAIDGCTRGWRIRRRLFPEYKRDTVSQGFCAHKNLHLMRLI